MERTGASLPRGKGEVKGKTVRLLIDKRLILGPLSQTPPGVVSQVKERLSFPNPAFLEAERLGFSTWNISPEIRGYRMVGDAMIVPRGFAAQLVAILRRAGVEYRLADWRRTLPPVDFTFQGELHDFQAEAVDVLSSRDFGVLEAPTGSGKTVMALATIARRRQPALVVVHTKELLEQWVSRTETFMGIPAREVEIIGGGKMKVGEKITVALVQSLYKCAGEVAPHIGHLVVDECHRAPARTFTEAITAFDCRYMLGLSATPWRRDKLSRLIYWHLGDKVHEVDKPALVDAGHVLQAEVVWRETCFTPTCDPSEEYSRVLSELAMDANRNALIAADVAREARDGGGVCLVLTDRKAHCEALQELLAERGITAEILTGDLGDRERARVVEDLNAGRVRVLVATGQLIGEGFDCRELSTLFLTSPIKFNGRLLQYLGRVLRPAPGKARAKVVDFLDVNVGVLMAAAKSRQRVYGG
jgi:superfamily II DNA or RNA helicase